MKIMQIMLSQSEAGAETYFEKVAAAFARDPSITQRLIIEELPSRERRLERAKVDFFALPMSSIRKLFYYNSFLKREVAEFQPGLIVTWLNRASRKCPSTEAVVVGRLGGYYPVKNFRRCDHLIVNTPDLVNHVVSHGWRQDKVSMISNFGELPELLEVPEPLPEINPGDKVLLALGRLHQKKAHDTLIRALPSIPGTTLLIAGNGDLRPYLESLTEEMGLSGRVHFLGLRQDIRRLFSRADVCVFPSRFEPLGNVILEAWATGTPVVSAASQGPSWLIEHGVNGLLFDVDDAEGCAREVNRVLADPGLAGTLVDGGRESFNRNFSMDIVIGQYKELFSKLIEKKRSAAGHR